MSTQSTNQERRKRKRGTGRVFPRRGILWISYCVDGHERRESAHTDDREVAEALLNRRIVEKEDNRLPPPKIIWRMRLCV